VGEQGESKIPFDETDKYVLGRDSDNASPGPPPTVRSPLPQLAVWAHSLRSSVYVPYIRDFDEYLHKCESRDLDMSPWPVSLDADVAWRQLRTSHSIATIVCKYAIKIPITKEHKGS